MGTSIDYSTVSHGTIYRQITGGPGGTELTETSRGWHSVAAKLAQLQADVEQAVRGIGVAQQGAAANAATHATLALVPWLEDSVAAARGLAERISRQAGSFGYTRDSMPQPVQVPDVSFIQHPGTWLAGHAVEWLPGIQTGHERDQVVAQQAEQRAQELMGTYQVSTNDNLASPERFAAAPAVVIDIADPALGGAGAAGAASGGAPGSPTYPGAAHPMVAQASPAPATHTMPGAPVVTKAPVVTPAQPQPVNPEVPPAGTPPALADDPPLGADGQRLTGSGQPRPAAAAPAYGPAPILAAPGAASTHSGSRIPDGATGLSRAGFGPRPTPTSGGGHALAAGAAEHAAPEHASTARPATRGGTGLSGVPLGATGSSGRHDSTEHRRPSYLLEPDASAIVGELPRVAPPVIGED